MSRIADIFRKIPEEEGDQIFEDPYRFFAIAEDFAGGTDAEDRKALFYLSKCGILSLIGQAYRETDSVRRQNLISQAEQKMLQGSFTEAQAARFLRLFCEAYHWEKITFIEDVKKEAERKRKERERAQQEEEERKKTLEREAARRREAEQKQSQQRERVRLEAEWKRKQEEQRQQEDQEKRSRRNKRIGGIAAAALLLAAIGFFANQNASQNRLGLSPYSAGSSQGSSSAPAGTGNDSGSSGAQSVVQIFPEDGSGEAHPLAVHLFSDSGKESCREGVDIFRMLLQPAACGLAIRSVIRFDVDELAAVEHFTPPPSESARTAPSPRRCRRPSAPGPGGPGSHPARRSPCRPSSHRGAPSSRR